MGASQVMLVDFEGWTEATRGHDLFPALLEFPKAEAGMDVVVIIKIGVLPEGVFVELGDMTVSSIVLFGV